MLISIPYFSILFIFLSTTFTISGVWGRFPYFFEMTRRYKLKRKKPKSGGDHQAG
jgi:hypothetical protein